jgi:hypothetical protein
MVPAVEGIAAPKPRKISDSMLAASRISPQATLAARQQIERYAPPPGVIPAGEEQSVLAMDSTPYDYVNTVHSDGAYFPGYPYLALLTQLPEYRKISETIAEEMTRKWITFHAVGDDDKSEKIKQIEEDLLKFNVRDIFRRAMELDGFFGRGQIYIDVDTPSGAPARADDTELQTPLIRDKSKITKGSLNGFKIIEPVWTYPNAYNSNDPLAPDYYKPTSWFVLGRKVHSSRLLMFVSREVPDLLKASYNFGGISLSQMAKSYVDNWTRTRDSVSDLIHSFSTSGIKTNMSNALSGGGGEDEFKRAELFNNMRDNRGVLMLDKDSGEEFFQFNVPLSGLDKLQAQSQEQLSSVSSIPLVKLLGISPAGLNATSEGEIEVFDDHIMAKKRNVMSAPLADVINIIQLNRFGEVDPDIVHEFDPMAEMTEIDQATVRKTNAETDAAYIAAGVISPDDARERLINDPDSGYTSLEANPDLGDNADDTQDADE